MRSFEKLKIFIMKYFLWILLLFPVALFSQQESLQEGFGKDTLVKTFCGYKKIQDIVVGDLLCSPFNQFQTVLSIQKKEISSYVKLPLSVFKNFLSHEIPDVHDQEVYVGVDQKFSYDDWKNACDCRYTISFFWSDLEAIHEPLEVYVLGVQDHVYYVTSCDLLVHNSDSIKRGIEALQVGCMMIEHPVAKVIGAILELASVGVDVYEMFKDNFISEEVVQEMQYHDVFIPGRFYYEIMRKKLQDLKQEFIDISNIVSGNYDFSDNSIVCDPFVITVAQEAVCSELQKKQLRYVREKELHQLEQDIVDLQYQIAWNFSELIDARAQALKNVQKVFGYVCDARSSIKNSEFSATQNQLIDLYVKEQYLEKMLNVYFDLTAKLLLIIHFFKQPSNAQSLKQTSNIMEVVARVEFEIISCDIAQRVKQSL